MNELMDIQRLKSLKVLLIGDSCIDLYYYGVCQRMSPEAPVPVFKVLRTEKSGGMALNVKANLKNLGMQVTLLTNDKEIIKARHIDNKSRQHLLRVDWGEETRVTPLSKEKINEIDFDSYDGVIVSDYNKGFLNSDNIETILSHASEKMVFVDSKKKDLSCYENCVIKINQKEREEATHFPTNCKLLVTLGEDGATYRNNTFPTEKVEIFDVCGAGDTFMSALAGSYLLTYDMERAISFANKCAGIVVQKFGTYAMKKEDIRDLCI